jgi:hypothetical protein
MTLSSDRINHDLHLDPANAYHAQPHQESKFTNRLVSVAGSPSPSVGDSMSERGQYRVLNRAGAFTERIIIFQTGRQGDLKRHPSTLAMTSALATQRKPLLHLDLQEMQRDPSFPLISRR